LAQWPPTSPTNQFATLLLHTHTQAQVHAMQVVHIRHATQSGVQPKSSQQSMISWHLSWGSRSASVSMYLPTLPITFASIEEWGSGSALIMVASWCWVMGCGITGICMGWARVGGTATGCASTGTLAATRRRPIFACCSAPVLWCASAGAALNVCIDIANVNRMERANFIVCSNVLYERERVWWVRGVKVRCMDVVGGCICLNDTERLEWRECGGGDKCKRRVLVFARYRQESSQIMTLLKGFASKKHN